MSQSIQELRPILLWKNFYQLTQIPRPSKHEEMVIKHIVEFGKSLGLKTQTDEVGNILISKPATEGFEDKKTAVLQAHIDMVPQKNSTVNHNFETDPIQTTIEDGWVTAIDTTLGADNGIGAAAMLAVLEDSGIQHGPLQCLFTIDEEAGMTGAFALKPGFVEGDILLNLDSEDEGELYVGCAGGVDVNVEFPLLMEASDKSDVTLDIALTGLKGGHSGLDIHLGRGNANKLIIRLLKELVAGYNARVATINGGTLRNAIPRESFATICIPSEEKEEVKQFINAFADTIAKEYAVTEPSLSLAVSDGEKPKMVFNEMLQDDLINSVMAAFNGVFRMDANLPGVVESSSNLSVIKTTDTAIEIQFLVRSSVESMKEWIYSTYESCFELAGAKVSFSGDYPGWKPNADSTILTIMKQVYHDNYGKIPEVKAIHAGLECGIIGATYPKLDMISFGPTICFPHSPDEKVNIETVGNFWDYLVLTLKHIPSK